MSESCKVDMCLSFALKGHDVCARHADPRTRRLCAAFGCFTWSPLCWQPDLCRACYVLEAGMEEDEHVLLKTEQADETRRLHGHFRGSGERGYGTCVLGTRQALRGIS